MTPEEKARENIDTLQVQAGWNGQDVKDVIADVEKFGIVQEITGGKRGKMYVYSDYLQLFK